MGNLTVRVLTEGVHSGDASGIVPSSFRIARSLLSRIEDEATGQIKLDELFVQVPPDRLEQARASAKILGDEVYTKMPLAGATKPMACDLTELILNRTWRPQLAVTAMDGYPLPENGGNVLLPYSTAKLSMRLPPTCDADQGDRALKKKLEEDRALWRRGRIRRRGRPDRLERAQAGALAGEASLKKASEAHFGKPVAFMGEGGSIPFMAMSLFGFSFLVFFFWASDIPPHFVVPDVCSPVPLQWGRTEPLPLPTDGKTASVFLASFRVLHAARGMKNSGLL